MVEKLYKEGEKYKKAGVMLSGLVPDNSVQGNLFEPGKNIGRFLMEMMDNINFSMRDDVVKFAASGTKRNWKMRQEFHSPRYTTRWDELYEVRWKLQATRFKLQGWYLPFDIYYLDLQDEASIIYFLITIQRLAQFFWI